MVLNHNINKIISVIENSTVESEDLTVPPANTPPLSQTLPKLPSTAASPPIATDNPTPALQPVSMDKTASTIQETTHSQHPPDLKALAELIALANTPTIVPNLQELLESKFAATPTALTDILDAYPALELYLESLNIQIIEQDIERLFNTVTQSLIDQVARVALMQFKYMTITEQWEGPDKDLCLESFCRCVQNISPENLIDTVDFFIFKRNVKAHIRKNKLHCLSLEELKKQILEYQFEVFKHRFDQRKYTEINKILRFLGSSMCMSANGTGDNMQIMLAEATIEEFHGIKIYRFHKEIMRTPVVRMAAGAFYLASLPGIILRDEGFSYAFSQKFGNAAYSSLTYKGDEEILNQLELRVLKLYQDRFRTGFADVKHNIESDSKEMVIHHEISHKLFRERLLDKNVCAVVTASYSWDDSPYKAVEEFMVEIFPQMEALCGPIQQIAHIASGDERRAMSMYYYYFSLGWHFPPRSKEDHIYSTLFSLFMVKFIKSNQLIDFKGLKEALLFSTTQENGNDGKIYKDLKRWIIHGSERMKDIMENATYFDFKGGGSCNYSQLAVPTINKYRVTGWNVEERLESNDSGFLAKYWTEFFRYLKSFSPDSAPLMANLFAEQEKILLDMLFEYSAGNKANEYLIPGDGGELIYDYQRYIREKLSFLTPPPKKVYM